MPRFLPSIFFLFFLGSRKQGERRKVIRRLGFGTTGNKSEAIETWGSARRFNEIEINILKENFNFNENGS